MRRSLLAGGLSAAGMLLAPAGAASPARTLPPVVAPPQPIDGTAASTVQAGEDEGRRITMPIHIDGKGPFDFIVDTGSERTVISRELARQLALAPDMPVKINAVTGIAQVDTVTIPRLSFGHARIESIRAPVLEAVNLGAPGLLGLDGLESKRLTIDFRRRRMDISDSGEAPPVDTDAIVVRARSRFGQLILVDSQANGEKIHVILDTGSDQSIGNLALLRKLTKRRKIDALKPIEITSVTGDTLMGGWTQVQNVKIGGFGIRNMAVVFADASPFHQLGLDDQPALLLGMDVLRRFDRVAVDFGRKKVFFLLPDGAGSQTAAALASL